MTRGRCWVLCLVALIGVTIGAPAEAQDFRGSIIGTIVDASGGLLPGVTVVITHDETKVSQTVVTDAKGVYQALYLNLGKYTITATLQGFKKVVRPNNPVTIGDALRVDIVLEAGGISEVVEVTADSPLINTTTGVNGITVDSKQIAQLPLGDGTAYMLTRLAPGIMDSSDLHFARPMDNGNLGGIVSNGVQGGSEFTIDGAPNLSNAKGVGFSPPSDAIAQFKVQTNAFDAQTGHTAGAVVNLALKSGTNAIRLQTGYFNRDSSRTATPLLTERAHGEKPTREYNRLTGTVGGPVIKGRTFFLFSSERLRDVQPEPSTFTVPTMKMRQGDFSEFTTPIYDPQTATGSSATRTPFANNLIRPERINPVAAAYAALYPEPTSDATNSNYFTNMLRPYDYHVFLGRVDHNITSANRVFANIYYNTRREDRYNWALGASNLPDGLSNGFAVTQGFDYRSNTGVTGGWTSVRSNTTILDVRGSFTEFGENRDPAGDFDPASLGFASAALDLMAGHPILPLMTFAQFSTTNQNSTIASLGTQRSDWGEGFDRPMVTLSISPTLTKLWQGHTVRAGYDLRHQRWTITNTGFPAGRYHFNGAYTRLNNSAPLNDRAQSFAQFLLGLPTSATGAVATPGSNPLSSQFEIASPGEFTQLSQALFAQDDWHANSRLTLNLGVRMEINGGMSEIDNRNLGGFDTTSSSPIEAAAVAAYAQNPIPQVPVADFDVKGGLLFADGAVNETKTKFLPRGGFSYLINKRTVLRGGVGLFSFDYFFENINQTGYSQATPVIVSNDNGLTFTGASLTNPIPSGTLIQPVGNALGLSSQLGQNLGTLYQPDREVPYYTRWELSVQHEMPHQWVAMFTYLGSRGTNLPVVRAVNGLPTEFLSTSRSRDIPLETVLGQNVPNPFAGLLPGSSFNGSTVARNQLMRPSPQFGTISIEQYDGSDRYEAASVMVEKRFKGGNSFTVQYTRSSTHDKLNYLNPSDNILEDRISPNDRPNRFAIGTSIELPFGHNGVWGKDWNAVLDAILGGWRVSGTYQYQSGFPLTWTNSTYWDESCGDPKSLKSNIGKSVSGGIAGLDVPGWDVSCFYFHDAPVQTNGQDDIVKQRADNRIQMGNNVRYFPSTLPDVRTHHLNLMDLGFGKSFRLPREATVQIRIELINALNYTVLWNPGLDPRASSGLFGIVNQDRNNPRDIQLGVRFTF